MTWLQLGDKVVKIKLGFYPCAVPLGTIGVVSFQSYFRQQDGPRLGAHIEWDFITRKVLRGPYFQTEGLIEKIIEDSWENCLRIEL